MIKLELEVAEINGILNALGQMPFIQVQALIAKVQSQASPQVVAQAPQEEKAGGTD